jgi:hypothetical protein
MKKAKFLLLFATAAMISFGVYAQKSKAAKPFTGTIKYDVTYEGEIDAMTKAQVPTSSVITFGEKDKVRVDLTFLMQNVSTINDYEAKTTVTLIDAMGQKIALTGELPVDEIENAEKPEIKLIDETKTIAGYKCKKAEVYTKEDDVIEVFYTEEFPSPKGTMLHIDGINGILFRLSVPIGDNGAIMTFTAKEAKKGKIKSHLFKIPDDYEKMTNEEFMQMIGQ